LVLLVQLRIAPKTPKPHCKYKGEILNAKNNFKQGRLTLLTSCLSLNSDILSC
jgi:hypothetical protein